MFPLLERYPGTVVLQDFFLSGILQYLEAIFANAMVFRRQLYYAHGYSALQLWKKEGAKKAVWHYPCNKKILEQAKGVIVHSRHAIDLAKAWYGQAFEHDLVQVPLPRRMPTESNRVAARKRLAIPENAFLVCTFGILGKIKLNDRLLEAWLPSALARDERCFLFFVGDGQGSSYEKSLRQTIGRSAYSDRIRITGYVEAEKFNDYLAAADVGVQLRSLSRGETSISVLDCMSHGLPTIVNVHGSFAELPDGVVCKLPDKFTDAELVKALEQLFSDKEYRDTLGLRGKDYVCKLHSPVLAARQYAEAIEEFAVHSQKAQQRRLLNKLSHMKGAIPSESDLAQSANAIAANQNTTGLKQIFVDVTAIVRDDLRTGIQRVVRSVLNNLFEKPPDGFRVEPVYRIGGQPAFRYARWYVCHFLGIDDVVELEDAPIFMSKGDIFLGLDFDPALDTDRRAFLREQSQRGLKIVFIVYDLLPLLNRKYFPPDSYNYHCEWVNTIASLSDGLVCISKSVADELCCYLNENQPRRKKDLNIGYFHLGADVLNSKPDKGFNKAASQVVELLKRHTVLLMVGTIEPRKGYVQALDAMEMLWAKGEELVLLIVGKHGWMVDLLIKRLRRHPENGKRLIWFESASDELLLKLYEVSTALLMASEGEGFGLPLIEAAQHGLPIIARDLPVFREVAGERAFYFSGNSGAELAGALSSWLDLYRQGKHPKSTGFSWLTWKQSTQQLLDVILNENWYQQWVPGCVERKNF
jgi:glycosyltransferase involved in cell wall biosynthesis